MFLKSYVIFNLLFVIVLGRWTDRGRKDIETEFYYGNVKLVSRTQLNCDLDLHRLYCRFKCRTKYGVCIEGNCYCVDDKQSEEKIPASLMQPKLAESSNDQSSSESNDTELSLNPVARHHIAHFCPTLEKAKQCIRTCTSEGKPAFCNKDHVCYCGHLYDAHSEDKALDPVEWYAKFRDMYFKYFGIDPHPDSPEVVEIGNS